MPGLENIAELWQQAADAGYAGGFVCGISVAVADVKSVVSYPRRERSGHSGHLSGGWGINSNLPYVSLSYQSIRSGADSAGDNSVPTPPAASGR